MSNTSRRILVASFLALFALATTAALGVWQYSRAYRADVEAQILKAKTIDLNQVSEVGKYVPENYYGQRVSVDGELICSNTFKNEIPNQNIDWHVAAIKLSDDSLIAVASVANYCELQSGGATWVGRIQPAQDFTQLPAVHKPANTVAAINTDDLVIRWQSQVRDGYLLITRDVPKNLIVLPPVGIDIRNLFYAWQWWLFAAFTIFLYSRFVRDELQQSSAQ